MIDPYFQNGKVTLSGPQKRMIIVIINALIILGLLGYININNSLISLFPIITIRNLLIAAIILSSAWVLNSQKGV